MITNYCSTASRDWVGDQGAPWPFITTNGVLGYTIVQERISVSGRKIVACRTEGPEVHNTKHIVPGPHSDIVDLHCSWWNAGQKP